MDVSSRETTGDRRIQKALELFMRMKTHYTNNTERKVFEMKFKKLIACCLALSFLLAGCGSGKDKEAGTIDTITLEALQEKINNKEDLTLVFTLKDCIHCKKFHTLLSEYLPTHNLTIYEVVLDEQTISYEKVVESIKPTFPEYKGTPDVYYVEDGAVKERFWNSYPALDEKNFKAFVDKHDLLVKSE